MLPALIAAGSSLLGGVLGMKSQSDANKKAEAANERNIALQKEFAQSGIQWKVQDAQKAGVHPLFALGANTTSFSPSSVGGGATDFSFLGETGQNIGRAISSSQSKPAQALAIQSTKLALEGQHLDNELKRTQLASAIQLATQGGSTPGIPGLFTRHAIPGQGGADPTDPTLSPAQHMLRQPQYTTNLRMFGKDISPSPRYSDAQSFEDRYGEMSDFIAGPINAYADYWRNMGPIYNRHITDKLRR